MYWSALAARLKSAIKTGCMLVLASLAAIGADAVGAQAFPDKTLTLVIPYAPGGVSDAIARTAAQALTQELRQAVIVVNRPGTGGAVADAAVLNAGGRTESGRSGCQCGRPWRQIVVRPVVAAASFDLPSSLFVSRDG